jgi:hypothetical protein
MHTKFWSGALKIRDHLEYLGVDRMIILKRMLNRYIVQMWVDSSGSAWDPMVGCCEHTNESSACMKGARFLDQLSNYQFLKDFDP